VLAGEPLGLAHVGLAAARSRATAMLLRTSTAMGDESIRSMPSRPSR
jgi:hypothetical protein